MNQKGELRLVPSSKPTHGQSDLTTSFSLLGTQFVFPILPDLGWLPPQLWHQLARSFQVSGTYVHCLPAR